MDILINIAIAVLLCGVFLGLMDTVLAWLYDIPFRRAFRKANRAVEEQLKRRSGA